MFTYYSRMMYRDRRRYGVSVALICATVILLTWHLEPPETPHFALPFPGIAVIALTGLPMVLVSVLLPRLRFWIESIAITLFAFALMGFILPHSPFHLMAQYPLVVSLGFLVLTGAVVRMALYGSWSDRLMTPGPVVFWSQSATLLTREKLFYGFLPLPGRMVADSSFSRMSAEYMDEAHRKVRLITCGPDEDMRESHIDIEDMRAPERARFRTKTVKGPRDRGVEGLTSFFITNLNGQNIMTVTHELERLPLRRALRGWLDDTLGRQIDSQIWRIEHAAGLASPHAPKGRQYLNWHIETRNDDPQPLPVSALSHQRRDDQGGSRP